MAIKESMLQSIGRMGNTGAYSGYLQGKEKMEASAMQERQMALAEQQEGRLQEGQDDRMLSSQMSRDATQQNMDIRDQQMAADEQEQQLQSGRVEAIQKLVSDSNRSKDTGTEYSQDGRVSYWEDVARESTDPAIQKLAQERLTFERTASKEERVAKDKQEKSRHKKSTELAHAVVNAKGDRQQAIAIETARKFIVGDSQTGQQRQISNEQIMDFAHQRVNESRINKDYKEAKKTDPSLVESREITNRAKKTEAIGDRVLLALGHNPDDTKDMDVEDLQKVQEVSDIALGIMERSNGKIGEQEAVKQAIASMPEDQGFWAGLFGGADEPKQDLNNVPTLSPEEYSAAPSGTRFRTQDGTLGTKP